MAEIINENIRKLCQKLKPILGSQIENLYSAYLAEDKQGKEQIQQYIQSLCAEYLPQNLDSNNNILIPPSKEKAFGEYKLGNVSYLEEDMYEFGLKENEWIQHIAVLGRTGAGKTNTGFMILEQLKRHNKPFLVFDWKRNYRDLTAGRDFKDVEIYTIGRNITPLAFNPLIPPQGTDPRTWLKKLNEVIAHSYCLGNGVLYLLQRAVDSVYQKAGVYDGTVEKWPTFKDVLLEAQGMDTRGRESGWLSSTLRALSALCFGDMDKLLNTSSNKSLDHILNTSVILELDALTQSDKVFFIQSLLLWTHHKRMTESTREQFKHAILIEEAHHILSDQRRSLVGGQSVMEIIFREIREFGESLILLDQHPSKINLSALGNTYCTICMNLKHKTDINAVAQCLLLDAERQILGQLDTGKAVVKLQGRIANAFVVNIPEFHIEKGRITDKLIQEQMAGITEPFESEDFRLTGEDKQKTLKPEKIAPEQSALLRDIKENPQSGIAARYKRLGISVRQGQKIKEKLLSNKLITESIKTTDTGRRRSIELTDEGENILL
jgi:predicted transcriptional regulator